jgi:hypothetical protein
MSWCCSSLDDVLQPEPVPLTSVPPVALKVQDLPAPKRRIIIKHFKYISSPPISFCNAHARQDPLQGE